MIEYCLVHISDSKEPKLTLMDEDGGQSLWTQSKDVAKANKKEMSILYPKTIYKIFEVYTA